MPALVRLLQSLGAAEALRACEPCYGIVSTWGRKRPAFQASITNPFGHAWFIHRTRFDACLQSAARNSGATWVTEKAQSAQFDSNGVSIATTGQAVRAQWSIFATGSSLLPARLTRQKPTKMDSMIAFWRIFLHIFRSDAIRRTLRQRLVYLCPADGPDAIACFVTDTLAARTLRPAQPPAWNNLLRKTKIFDRLEDKRPHSAFM